MMNAKRFFNRIISFASTIVMTAVAAANVTANTFAAEEFDHDAMVNELAVLVNEAREEAGLGDVYVLPYLNEVAQTRTIETTISFDHRTRNGEGFDSAIDTEMVSFSVAAEAIAAGYSTARETFDSWMNNENDRNAILAPEMTHIGVDVLYDEESKLGYYWQITLISTEQSFAEQYIPETASSPKAEGDITGDGKVDTFDYLTLITYLDKSDKGISTMHLSNAQLQTSDCFRDGILSKADAKVMVEFILGEIDTIPCEAL